MTPRVLQLSGVPWFGGTVALECEWTPAPELVREAQGEPISLATHVRDAAGQLLIHDGPRSLPVAAGAGARPIVLPLTVPTAPGEYELEIDPVVEGRFWASSRGMSPERIRVLRAPGGDLTLARSGGAAQTLRAAGRFQVPAGRYGLGETERCVEVPWVLSRYAGEARVLDVGSAHAEDRYLDALRLLRIPALVGLDLVPPRKLRAPAVAADVRFPPLRGGSFDLVLAISVIEHVGRDNSVYLRGQHGPRDTGGDLASVRALAGLLVPGGRLLVTVPFGAFEDHGWFIQYDLELLDRLVSQSGLRLEEREYFEYRDGWSGPLAPEGLAGRRYGQGAAAAAAIACLTLRKGAAG